MKMTASLAFRHLCLIPVLALAACATAYQPAGLTGGYKERPLGDNRWFVEFYGNGNTNQDTVLAYWLHRCAELTLLKGFDYFVFIAKRPDDVSDSGAASGYVPAQSYYSYTITTYSGRGVIEMHNGSPGFADARGFKAKELLDKLGPLVREASSRSQNISLPTSLRAFLKPEAPRRSSGRVTLDDLDGLLQK